MSGQEELETLYLRYCDQQDVWDKFNAFNDIVDLLEVNLECLGVNHPFLLSIFRDFYCLFHDETKCFMLDAPESRAPDLLRILSDPKWDKESCPTSLKLLCSNLERTVESVDASKIQVRSRVAVWFWEHQDYCSGEVSEVKEGGIFFVYFDLAGYSACWVSPKRRHTMLLSNGSEDPTPLPQSSADELQVGKRAIIWYGKGYDSFYSGDIIRRDETQIEVKYDYGERQVIPLDKLHGSLPFCVITRNDAGSVDSVTIGDSFYIKSKDGDKYWLGTVLGVADGEENNKDIPTRYRIQYYFGDLQVCDLSEMSFFPGANPIFSSAQTPHLSQDAKAEWAKFAKVAALLNTVNEYMAIYNRLQESGELIIVGSFGQSKPQHDIPSSYTEGTWNELPLQEQYQELVKMAQQTEPHMDTLGQQISELFDVKFSNGPLKGEGRIMQKCNKMAIFGGSLTWFDVV
mmetsp:Transcript_26300/g.64111  ORF Transcript_26300/g.64111 Transcript_26300/m.64111 type:complete len:458 (+) Transcript_26300:91-1464(+)